MNQLTVCVDFDGVLNDYDGVWNGPFELGQGREGCTWFLRELAKYYRVVVYTSRSVPHVLDWLFRRFLTDVVAEVTNQKPIAHVYIDDRAICFQGNYAETVEQVVGFKAHYEMQSVCVLCEQHKPPYRSGMCLDCIAAIEEANRRNYE